MKLQTSKKMVLICENKVGGRCEYLNDKGECMACVCQHLDWFKKDE